MESEPNAGSVQTDAHLRVFAQYTIDVGVRGGVDVAKAALWVHYAPRREW